MTVRIRIREDEEGNIPSGVLRRSGQLWDWVDSSEFSRSLFLVGAKEAVELCKWRDRLGRVK